MVKQVQVKSQTELHHNRFRLSKIAGIWSDREPSRSGIPRSSDPSWTTTTNRPCRALADRLLRSTSMDARTPLFRACNPRASSKTTTKLAGGREDGGVQWRGEGVAYRCSRGSWRVSSESWHTLPAALASYSYLTTDHSIGDRRRCMRVLAKAMGVAR
jgi:hypothetical protein